MMALSARTGPRGTPVTTTDFTARLFNNRSSRVPWSMMDQGTLLRVANQPTKE